MAITDQLYEFGGDLTMVDDAGNDIMDYAERSGGENEAKIKKWLRINGFRPKNRDNDDEPKDKRKKDGGEKKKKKTKSQDSEDAKSKSCSVM